MPKISLVSFRTCNTRRLIRSRMKTEQASTVHHTVAHGQELATVTCEHVQRSSHPGRVRCGHTSLDMTRMWGMPTSATMDRKIFGQINTDLSSDTKQTCCPSGARVLGREAMRDKRLAHSPLSSCSIRELCAACAHGRTAWRICQNLRDRARSREHDKHRKGGHKGATRTSSCNRWQLGSALPKRISSPSGAPHSDLSPARWQECGGFRAVPFGHRLFVITNKHSITHPPE